jgi:peptide deformylase
MRDDLEVLLYGHPMLRETCFSVERFDDKLRALANAMHRTMKEQKGIGLAAPQVGRPIRLLLASNEGSVTREVISLVNPELIFQSQERDVYNEGCLSLPEIYADVERPVRIRVRYQDLEGHEQELEDDGWLARIIQHEYDHLEGKLFVDHLSLLRRRLISKKLKAIAARSRQQV